MPTIDDVLITCPKRGKTGPQKIDQWTPVAGKVLVCSFCRSLSPDDVLNLLKSGKHRLKGHGDIRHLAPAKEGEAANPALKVNLAHFTADERKRLG